MLLKEPAATGFCGAAEMDCNAAAAATCRNDTSLLRADLALQSHERAASAIGRLYRGIGGVQRRTGWRETTSFRGFGKAAAEGISSAAMSGFGGKRPDGFRGCAPGNPPPNEPANASTFCIGERLRFLPFLG